MAEQPLARPSAAGPAGANLAATGDGASPTPERGADADLVRALLGGDELAWLVERVRSRLERRRERGAVTLKAPTDGQRRAVAELLGRPVSQGTSLTVPLAAVEEALARAGATPDLRAAIEALTGPIGDRKAQRSAWAVAWTNAVEPAWDLWDRRPELDAWGDWLRTSGILRRLTGDDPVAARHLMQRAVAVLERLPADGVTLPALAQAAVGEPDALDQGSPLARLVLRAAADLGGMGRGGGAEWRRSVWASVGVLTGELLNPVLVLNLPWDRATPAGASLARLGDAGQPAYLTARELLLDGPSLAPAPGGEVFVCESPAVVAAAADRLGPAAAPLVCVGARPGAAATVVLRALRAGGARARCHGDFDWPGIRVVNALMARFGAAPWRMDSAAYRAAAGAAGPAAAALTGRPVEAAWDPLLAVAMGELGRRVEEARVVEDLLADLAR